MQLETLPLHPDVAEWDRAHHHKSLAGANRVIRDLQSIASRGKFHGRCIHHSLQRTSYTRTGSSKPLATNSPRSAKRKPLPEQRPRTVSATRISPPSAFAAMRDARITVAPKRSPSFFDGFAGVEADANGQSFESLRTNG